MSDTINREAAIAYAISGRVRTLPTSEDGEDWIRTEEVRQSLLTMPSAEPERKVEKWITKHPYRDDLGKGPQLDLRFHFPSCSNCGAVFGYTPYYCPNCGSKMKNGTEWLDWDTGYGVQEGEEDDSM